MKRIRLWAVIAMLLAAGACKREAAAPEPGTPANPAPAVAAPQPVALKDVVESDSRYIVGISYPRGAADYPQPLAQGLQRYADAARGELLQAIQGLGAQKPSAPYDMSLSFTEVTNTPQVLTVAADGSVYTGGAHGNPLMARFVWLPQQQKLLTSRELLADPAQWKTVSDYVREQLHVALSQRVDADDLTPAERDKVVKGAGRMIDEGTRPDAANFEQFEPVLDARGSIIALRFVFPPYQVGPYADGVQTVDVPAQVLMPLLSREYLPLFSQQPQR